MLMSLPQILMRPFAVDALLKRYKVQRLLANSIKFDNEISLNSFREPFAT
jgi:hypothetical protein